MSQFAREAIAAAGIFVAMLVVAFGYTAFVEWEMKRINRRLNKKDDE